MVRKALFRSENFPYDADQDEFICPADQRLSYQITRRQRTENGYWTESRIYTATACNSCPLKPECTRAKGNRRMYASFRLRRFREQARNNLLSEHGRLLRALRSEHSF